MSDSKIKLDQVAEARRIEVRKVLKHVLKEAALELIAAASPIDSALKINFREEVCDILKEIHTEFSVGTDSNDHQGHSKMQGKT